MKVGQRLFLTVLPAVLGVITVAGLAYWGQYAHEAPLAVVLLAGAAALGSLGMAWHNTRYVARRIERLAVRATRNAAGIDDIADDTASERLQQDGAAPTSTDELDDIETTVHQLSGAVTRVRNESTRREEAAVARAAEYAAIVEEIAGVMTARLEEAELPLHVLLSSPFGSLNENQEEMLAAAHGAVGSADAEVRRLKSLIDLDRAAIPAVPQAIGLSELLRPTRAIAEARAHVAHVSLRVQVSDTAPRAVVDPVHTQAALTTILEDAVSRAGAGSEVDVDATECGTGQIRITITHHGAAQRQAVSLQMRLARRLLALQRGSLLEETERMIVELPAESLTNADGVRDSDSV